MLLLLATEQAMDPLHLMFLTCEEDFHLGPLMPQTPERGMGVYVLVCVEIIPMLVQAIPVDALLIIMSIVIRGEAATVN